MKTHAARLLLLALSACAAPAEPARGETRPNLLFLLADDMGYGDLSGAGHPVLKTPHLDRLAAEGVRLTACYSAGANCSPSRAGLITGRFPLRAGIENYIHEGAPVHLRRGEPSVAALLRDAGYATAHVGKWHLNGRFNSPEQPQPSDHGFEHWFSTQNNSDPSHLNPVNFVRNGTALGPLQGYSSALIVDEALRWLRARPAGKPFCLFVWFHSPHEFLATPEAFARPYLTPDDPKRAVYLGNVAHLDHEIGRLVGDVDASGLRDSTFVFFTSDNGPSSRVPHPYGSAGPFREFKGHVYEGGIRVPGIVRWPGRVAAGGTSDVPVHGVDLLPTLCALGGAPVPERLRIDGTSFLPALEGRPLARRTPLYWQFNRAHTKPKAAMRQGDWKILATLTGPELKVSSGTGEQDMQILKAAELDAFELYNLREDPGETRDLAGAEGARLEAMAGVFRKLYREVRDEGPVWPAWKPSKKP